MKYPFVVPLCGEIIVYLLAYSLEMADLLQRLETGHHRAAGTSERLRSQVDRIDGYMRESRRLDLTAPSIATQTTGTKPELAVPSAYQPAIRSTPGPGVDQMSQFQIPPELLADWPWPFDSSNSDSLIPLMFE